jgi:hypothetical protein
VLVSDFARLHIYRRVTGERIQMDLGDLPQKIDRLKTDPIAAKYIHPFLMGHEFINNIPLLQHHRLQQLPLAYPECEIAISHWLSHWRKIAAAQLILDERQAEENRCAKQGQTCSLATLYAAGNLPQGLVKAHSALDKAVDNAYGYKGEPNDAARVAFLFGLYRNYLEHL